MMLGEKYAFEAKCLVADPQIEVPGEQCRHIGRIKSHAWATQLEQELQHPGLIIGNSSQDSLQQATTRISDNDHVPLPMVGLPLKARVASSIIADDSL